MRKITNNQITSQLIMIIALVLSSLTTSQAGTRVGIESLKVKSDANIELKSQSMIFNSKNETAKFVGDVTVNYGKIKMQAEQLTFFQSKEKIDNLTFSAYGSIIISSGNNFINGDQADFILEKQQLTISGNVGLNQDNHKMTGDKLILDLKNGIASISGSVRTIINPNGE